VKDADALAFARDELVRLIGVRSFSDEEHEIVALLESRCRELELPVRRQPVEGSADNLVISWVDRPGLLLQIRGNRERRHSGVLRADITGRGADRRG